MSVPYYRILWEKIYGPIPVDEYGRSYEIHHINGDHFDDKIENLRCVSIKDHYQIHLEQGDIMACCAIKRRMDAPIELTEEQQLKLSVEASIAAKKRVEKGTHNFLGGKIQKAHQERRKKNGTHNFINTNPNYTLDCEGNKITLIICVDRNGNIHRLPSTKYKLQDVDDPEFVFHRSKEGIRRRSLYK